MLRFRRPNVSWIFASLLCVGCSGTNGTMSPHPTSSPPIVTGAGALAVVNVANADAKRVWVFPPHSQTFSRELLTHGSHLYPNSLAFDRRGNLYVGINDTSSGSEYHVAEINLQSGEIVRQIRVPQWSESSVATDDHDDLYVNTKSFIGGDIKIYSNNPAQTKPYIEIKDHRSPLTMLVTRYALSVGYETPTSYALARYALRSTVRVSLHTLGDNRPRTLVENNEGSLLAALVSRKSGGRAVDVIDVRSGIVARTLVENGRLDAMTGDRTGHIYIAQSEPGQSLDGEIHVCNYRSCQYSIKTGWGKVMGLAVNPLDGMLYASFSPKPVVQAYDTRTGKEGMLIAPKDFKPQALGFEP